MFRKLRRRDLITFGGYFYINHLFLFLLFKPEAALSSTKSKEFQRPRLAPHGNSYTVTITSALLLTYWCIVPLLIACAAWFRRQKQDLGTEQLVGEDSTGLKMGQIFTDLLAV
nr:unnamed protein product [Spirometra erinaceieuropaei]